MLYLSTRNNKISKKPSEAGTGNGTTIYGDASITYSQSSNNTIGYSENYAGCSCNAHFI